MPLTGISKCSAPLVGGEPKLRHPQGVTLHLQDESRCRSGVYAGIGMGQSAIASAAAQGASTAAV